MVDAAVVEILMQAAAMSTVALDFCRLFMLQKGVCVSSRLMAPMLFSSKAHTTLHVVRSMQSCACHHTTI